MEKKEKKKNYLINWVLNTAGLLETCYISQRQPTNDLSCEVQLLLVYILYMCFYFNLISFGATVLFYWLQKCFIYENIHNHEAYTDEILSPNLLHTNTLVHRQKNGAVVWVQRKAD